MVGFGEAPFFGKDGAFVKSSSSTDVDGSISLEIPENPVSIEEAGNSGAVGDPYWFCARGVLGTEW